MALVGDGEAEYLFDHLHLDVNRAGFCTVGNGIGEQVGEQLRKPPAVAIDVV